MFQSLHKTVALSQGELRTLFIRSLLEDGNYAPKSFTARSLYLLLMRIKENTNLDFSKVKEYITPLLNDFITTSLHPYCNTELSVSDITKGPILKVIWFSFKDLPDEFNKIKHDIYHAVLIITLSRSVAETMPIFVKIENTIKRTEFSLNKEYKPSTSEKSIKDLLHSIARRELQQKVEKDLRLIEHSLA